MEVENINGIQTGDREGPRLLALWEEQSGQPLPFYCAEARCVCESVEGALVQRANTEDNRWYIVPLCREHGALKGQRIMIMNTMPLVPLDT